MMVLPYILEISEDDTFVAISAGSRHSMALNANGICFGFGWNFYNQVIQGNTFHTKKCDVKRQDF